MAIQYGDLEPRIDPGQLVDSKGNSCGGDCREAEGDHCGLSCNNAIDPDIVIDDRIIDTKYTF